MSNKEYYFIEKDQLLKAAKELPHLIEYARKLNGCFFTNNVIDLYEEKDNQFSLDYGETFVNEEDVEKLFKEDKASYYVPQYVMEEYPDTKAYVISD